MSHTSRVGSHLLSYFLGCTTMSALGYFYLSDEFQVYAGSLLNTSKHLHLSAKQLTDVRYKIDHMSQAIEALSLSKLNRSQVDSEIRPIRELVNDYHLELNELNTKFNAMQKELFYLSKKCE
eukprot:NODE_515_length_7357_cov_0.487875.p5 type:complete len:122 gc:universal NODE_515_length_7357_cov_0.487875:2192-1827(-)